MKRLLLLIVFIFSFLQQSFSQNPLVKQWDYRFGGWDYDILHSIKQTADEGYILGGMSMSDSSFDKTQDSWGNWDYWIVKTDSLGIKQWDKDFGGTDWDNLTILNQTTDGGYILGGSSKSGIGGNKSEANWDTIGITWDYWIVKTDSLGNKQWDKEFGGTNDDYLSSVQQTTDGGYILGGWSYSNVGGNKTDSLRGGTGDVDYWIIKTDVLGNKQWDKDFGGTNWDVLSSLQQTTDGGYILGGSSGSGISGDKSQSLWGGTGDNDYWIVKIDSSGIKQWDKDFGGTSSDALFSLQQTADVGYILGGSSYSGISGVKTQTNCGYNDYWIVKIDSSGVKQWDKDFGGILNEYFFGNVSQTADGGYLIAGNSESNISCEKTENNFGFGGQTWIVKTNALGNKEWDKTLLTNTVQAEAAGYALQSKDLCYVMANATKAGSGGDKTQDSRGGWDYWFVKFCDSTLTTSNTQLSNTQLPFSIYPNPANELLVISDKGTGKKEIEIYDLFGRTVFESVIYNLQSTIDISKLSPGIYFLKAGNEVKKFVKE